MTREELRDYVDEQRSLGNIPYHVYSTLIDGIDTLEQEPKPMVEIDLYSVIKQKYIEREVLDKIRAEVKAKIEEEEFARSVFRHEEKDTVKAEQCTGSIMAYKNVIKFIDKYKAESEDNNEKSN